MGRKRIGSSFKPSKKTLQEQATIAHTMNVCEAVKMIALYVLRNQGWGAKRLKEFSDKWNEYLLDVSNGWFSLSDILAVIEEETGLTMDDIKIPFKESDGIGNDNLTSSQRMLINNSTYGKVVVRE